MLRVRLMNLFSLVVAGSILLSGGIAAAAPATQATKPIAANGSASSSGLKISPVRSDITVNAGSTQIVPVTVENVTSQVASYKVVINDFTAATDETGQPQIILDSNQFAQSHSLKRLVGDIPDVTLSPGQTANINVPVTVPKDYKAGGYYGAVRFVPASSDNAASKNVTLSASVGSLILVTVPGDIREALSVASLDVRKIVGPNQIDAPRTIFSSPDKLKATVRFQNAGDIQEQPFGKIQLQTWRGKIIANYEVNNETPRGNVLPGSIRKFDIPFTTKLGKIGAYKLVGNFGYGSNGSLITASTNFYIIPFWAIVLFVLLIVLLLAAIFGLPRAIKAYNRRVVARSQSRRR